MVLVAALTIALPGSTEAAGHGSVAPAAQSGDVWGLVVSWLADLWNGAVREPAAGYSSVFDNSGSAGAPSETATTTTTCKGDQGVCIDPNG
jgi:hypothetical protein